MKYYNIKYDAATFAFSLLISHSWHALIVCTERTFRIYVCAQVWIIISLKLTEYLQQSAHNKWNNKMGRYRTVFYGIRFSSDTYRHKCVLVWHIALSQHAVTNWQLRWKKQNWIWRWTVVQKWAASCVTFSACHTCSIYRAPSPVWQNNYYVVEIPTARTARW